jgi:hypothetical protein
MPNWIEPAKTARSKCVICDKVIDKGVARLSEETSDIGIPTMIQRYYHLRCALATIPDVLRRALGDIRGNAVIEDRATLEAKLAEHEAREEQKRKDKYEAAIAAEREAVVVKQNLDPVTFELTEQLLDNPDDTGALTVLADQLQHGSDPRGELIAVQLALAAAGPRADLLDDDDDDDDDGVPLSAADREIKRQLDRRRKLLDRFALPIDPNDRCLWGVGFVRRLELIAKTGTRLSALAAIWKNPSVRLLSELHVTFVSDHDAAWSERLVDLVPPSLRRLELGRVATQPLAGVPALVAALPRLSALSLVGKTAPTLARLELGVTAGAGQSDLPAIVQRMQRKQLPKLVDLAVRFATPRETVPLCDALATGGWLKQLTHLALHNADGEALDLLVASAGKRKLARLDLTGTRIRPKTRDALAKIAKEVVAPDLAAAEAILGNGEVVIHLNKPEWGRGRIVRRFDGKLEIEFPGGGTKVLKADAPFLQIVE